MNFHTESQLYKIVVIPLYETRDVSLPHAPAVELEHCLAIVWFNTDCFRPHSALLVSSADIERQIPVLAHSGVVDVHDQMLTFTGPGWKPVRAPVVLQLLSSWLVYFQLNKKGRKPRVKSVTLRL